jgi:hypothetical protein
MTASTTHTPLRLGMSTTETAPKSLWSIPHQSNDRAEHLTTVTSALETELLSVP